MSRGSLFYNAEEERYDIRFRDGNSYGGIHCGQIVKIKGKMFRMEYGDKNGWYLVGCKNQINDYCGSTVEIIE